MAIPLGPDVVFTAPTSELVSQSNPPRRRAARLEVPEVPDPGYENCLVRTALVRSDKYDRAASPIIASSGDVRKLLHHLAYADQEHFVVISVDVAMRVLAIHETAVGGTAGVNIELRHALKVAFLTGGDRFFIAHNHPSGSAIPSKDDVVLTFALHRAAKCAGLTLLDHFIVALEETLSFYDRSLGPYGTLSEEQAILDLERRFRRAGETEAGYGRKNGKTRPTP